MILNLHNVRIVPSNVRKNKGTTKCDKGIVTCVVDTAKYKDDTIECERKKKKRITECDKSTVICDVGTTQFEDGSVKCEKK